MRRQMEKDIEDALILLRFVVDGSPVQLSASRDLELFKWYADLPDDEKLPWIEKMQNYSGTH